METISKTICINSKVNGKQPSLTDRVYDTNGCSTTIATSPFFTGSILEEPIAYDEQNKCLRKDGTCGTLTTDGSSPKHNNRVIEPNLKTKMCNDLIKKGLVKDGDVIRHSYTRSRMNGEMKDIKENNMCPTLDTRADCLGVVQDYRIRKLTPKECWRLMGFDDSDFEKAKSAGISDSQLYKQAGNSIVVNVLELIFREMI